MIASEVEQAAVRRAAGLRDRFGADVLAVAARPGVGPGDGSVPLLSLDLPPAGSLMLAIRTAGEALADPPREVLDRIDAWDPGGQARVLADPIAIDARLLGRSTFGSRDRSWIDLEDKLAIEEVWAAAGVVTAPSAQVDAGDGPALLAAHRDLATDLGTVWAGDNASGWHGGAQGTYWVGDEATAEATVVELAPFDRVRVMPFIEGVPCAIHGLVPAAPARPAVLRPCEMMMLRDREARRFVYARASTFWDPQPADREAMRDTARRIGTELRRRVDYRGVFTVDGVLGVDGFVPTEVNTRFGAALPSTLETLAGDTIDLMLVNRAVVEGLLDDLDPEVFERWAVAVLDEHRQASSIVETPKVPTRARSGALIGSAGDGPGHPVLVDDDWLDRHPGVPDAPILATVHWGAGPPGGVLRLVLSDHTPIGPPTAPLVVELLEAIGRSWPVGLPPLEAATPVR